MKKIISAICAVVLLISSVSVSAFALTKEDADAELAVQNATFKKIVTDRIDVNGSGKIEAADARLVLLRSAGLPSDNLNEQNADIDKDGKITAIDARIFLRISAQLENIEDYLELSDSEKFAYFLSIINSVKPNRYTYYKSTAEEIQKVDYVDYSNLVGQMNEQFSYIGKYFPEMQIDFAKELKASEGEKSAFYSMANSQVVTKYNYPVNSNDLAFLATMEDIEKIEYKTNQSFTFTRYKKENIEYSETVTGLASITVYVKPESVSLAGNTNGVFDNLRTGKAFDILSEADLDELISSNSSIGSIDGMEDLGKCEIKISPKNLQYKNCYITVYFNPETGVPMVSVHNLHYIMNMNMYMDIDISTKNIASESEDPMIAALIKAMLDFLTRKNDGRLLKVNGNMDILNEMNTQTVTYFKSNNSAHIPYN